MELKIDKGTGYMYSYQPSHYCANKAGKVLEHVFVMSEAIGRMLYEYECVHHKDRNRTNNNLENLMLLTKSEHAKLHQMEDNGVVFITANCGGCKKGFLSTEENTQKFCSISCARASKAKFDVSKEQLEFLVWSYPTTKVAKMLGVSDVAVAKR